jgi:hypothetical protein
MFDKPRKQTLQATIADLVAGNISVEAFPPIRVVRIVKGEEVRLWVTLDNRRLHVFRQARCPLIPVEVRMRNHPFTVQLNGLSDVGYGVITHVVLHALHVYSSTVLIEHSCLSPLTL